MSFFKRSKISIPLEVSLSYNLSHKQNRIPICLVAEHFILHPIQYVHSKFWKRFPKFMIHLDMLFST